MGRYIARRLLQFIPTVLGAMALLHYLTVVGIQLTGNPVRAMFGDRRPTDAQIAAISAKLGLDDPCLTHKFDLCGGMFVRRLNDIFLHFDFGINQRRVPVTELVARALPDTAKLAIVAFIIELVIGLAAGILAGLRNGSFWDYLVKITTVLFISVPVFVVGKLVQTFVAVPLSRNTREWSWVPDWLSLGVFSPVYKAGDFPWSSLVIPALVLASLSLATTARLTRTSLMENVRSDYVRTAKAKGLTPTRVVGIHTLRNSLIPVVTSLGLDLAALMSGAVVTETIFSVPGIGRLVTISARTGETYVVLGVVTMIVLVVMVANLLVDLLYAVLDPRIRYE
jgi:peptide/nickel transport system permease protein/oligopeptide transport system permease protein